MPRVTRAADHLSLDEAQQRRAQTSHPWHRRAWDVVYTALAAPRPAPRIAQQLGVSVLLSDMVDNSFHPFG